ncbi:unnamed protein product [Alternaria alternata]
MNQPPIDVEEIGPDTTFLSSSDFQTLLQTTDENVPYRIVIAVSNRVVPSRMIEDVLGLGLDLEPEIFDFVKGTVEATAYIPEDDFPLPWFKDAPALPIMFLRDNSPEYLPRDSLGFTMFSSKRPSQMRERPSHDSNHYPRHDKKSLVERYIHEAVQSKNKFGPGNFLYVCLAALLELHLSTAPTSVFHIADFGYYQGLMRKYRRNFEDMANDFPPVNNYPGMATNEPLPVDTYPDMGWRQLRVELDDQRYTLRWMTRFFKRHLDYRNKDLQAAFKELRGRFKLRVQDLEQVESQLRDQMASEGIDKSIRMAEMSIRESKRVMLCMLPVLLCLFFLLTGSK